MDYLNNNTESRKNKHVNLLEKYIDIKIYFTHTFSSFEICYCNLHRDNFSYEYKIYIRIFCND